MNTILDVLKLRRVRLEYVSPPVCPILASGSGSGVLVDVVDAVAAPTGLAFIGQCGRFLVWDDYVGAQCISLFRSVQVNEPNGAYELVSECLPARTVAVCSIGWWRITTTDETGLESPQTDLVESDGSGYVQIPIPRRAGAVSFTLYRNPELSDVEGTYTKVFSSPIANMFEVCAAGCYKLQAVTLDGASNLSESICIINVRDVVDCTGNFKWHVDICDCVCEEVACQQGYHFDFNRCQCWCDVMGCPGNFRWETEVCACVCDPGTCEDSAYHWDLSVCDCVVNGCPEVTVFPTLASWGGTYDGWYYTALAEDLQVMWLPAKKNAVPAISWVSTVDLTLVEARLVTHPADTAAEDWGEVSIWDNPYTGYAVVWTNQGYAWWFNRFTRAEIIVNRPSWDLGGFKYRVASFNGFVDPGAGVIRNGNLVFSIPRGLIGPVNASFDFHIMWGVPTGDALAMKKYVHATGGHAGSHMAYVPENDCLYVSEWSDPTVYHRFRMSDIYAASGDITPNKTVGANGAARSLFYLPHIKLLVASTVAGRIQFYDPLNTYGGGEDSLVWEFTGVSPNPVGIDCAVYDICDNKIYLSRGTQSAGVTVVTPNFTTGFTSVGLPAAGVSAMPMQFDQTSNFVIVGSYADWTLRTF